MARMWSLLCAALLFLQGTGFAPFDVSALSVAPPILVRDLDRKTLRGEPSKLAWSPDGNYVAYLEQQGRSKFRLTSIALLRVDTPLQ